MLLVRIFVVSSCKTCLHARTFVLYLIIGTIDVLVGAGGWRNILLLWLLERCLGSRGSHHAVFLTNCLSVTRFVILKELFVFKERLFTVDVAKCVVIDTLPLKIFKLLLVVELIIRGSCQMTRIFI